MHFSDTVSADLTLPIGAKDMEILETPEHCKFFVANDSAYEDGHNSERQPFPWDDLDLIDPNNFMLSDDYLLASFPPFPPMDPIVKNVTHNFLCVPQILKLNIEELKKQLNKHVLSIKGNNKDI